MKKNIFLFWVLLSTLVGGVSCSSEELPANPTIVSPVSSLVLYGLCGGAQVEGRQDAG
jgi:hypothetical protein